MRTQNKILVGIIAALIISISYINVQKFFFNLNKKSNIAANGSGAVKSVQDANIGIENLINPIPQKNQNYYEPKIWANSYVLLDQKSFYPLAEKNMNQQVPIASTTKIMTAIIVLENYKLDDVVAVSQNAYSQIGSDSFLRVGEKITVRDLLYCLLIKSDNEAAMALAEHKTGNYKDFVQLMNKKAEYLNMKNTEFKDPAGLDDAGYSTPHNLAVITAYALKNEIFRQMVKTPEITITADNGLSYSLENSNRLVRSDEPLYFSEAIGVKTGFTPDAGHCLVSAAEKNGHILISVVLNTFENTNDASAKESKKLLEWGFENYEWKQY